ncbi:MAG: hypothetical protein MHPSP_004633, partial [Paramarteilia canceri]
RWPCLGTPVWTTRSIQLIGSLNIRITLSLLLVVSEMADARKRRLSYMRRWKVATSLLEAKHDDNLTDETGDNDGFHAIPSEQDGSVLEFGEVGDEVHSDETLYDNDLHDADDYIIAWDIIDQDHEIALISDSETKTDNG